MSTTIKKAPLTQEEKKEQIIRFLGQKREQYTLSILSNLSSGLNSTPNDSEAKRLVDAALLMADYLMEKLYPVED